MTTTINPPKTTKSPNTTERLGTTGHPETLDLRDGANRRTSGREQQARGSLRKRRIVATVLVMVAALVAVALIAGTDSATSPVVDTTPDGTVSDHFLSINDVESAVAVSAPAIGLAGGDLDHFLSINDVESAVAVSAPAIGLAGGDLDHFLSINDADQPAAPSATMAEGERAFFLSINDVDE